MDTLPTLKTYCWQWSTIQIQELGWRRILRSRSENPVGLIRAFKVPVINFEAASFHSMIEWKDYSEPPLTKHVSDSCLINSFKTKIFERIDKLKRVPCHTQSVERHIKLVTEASSQVCGHHNREGFIKVTLNSRKKITSFKLKRHFNV